MPTVLWWGRFDPEYSRNRILRDLFCDLGWDVIDFKPRFSALAWLEKRLNDRNLPKPDLVWVPCFRQRDIFAARRWSRRHGIKLIVDPLISAYDKQVFERHKFNEGSWRADRLRRWEESALNSAELVIADTRAHADFYCHVLGVRESRVKVVYVGAEEALFIPEPPKPWDGQSPLEVLFYGSFIGLQGPEFIVEAARKYQGPPVKWVLLGAGPVRNRCEELASGVGNIVFEDWCPYAQLPQRIQKADVLLGIFGTTAKAARVIPNKVFQSLACGRPVITRKGLGYPNQLTKIQDSGVVWVNAGDPGELAEAVRSIATDRSRLVALGLRAADTYNLYFSKAVLRQQLQDVLTCLAAM